MPALALFLAIALLSVAIAAAAVDLGRDRDALQRQLTAEAAHQADKLENYFARARSLTLVTARNPSFRQFYERPGSRRSKVMAQGDAVDGANEALAYLEELFRGSIGEACFIDRAGPENARAVRGDIAPIADLSADETKAPFFKPTFALPPGQVYQARPYLSPDTGEWSVSNSTPIASRAGASRSIVHFEITMESFRQEAAETSGDFSISIVEARSGSVVSDSRFAQPAGVRSRLGRPGDRRFARLASAVGRASEAGSFEAGGRPSAFRRLAPTPNNANQWLVVASADNAGGSLLKQFGVLEATMVVVALLLLGFALLSFRASQGRLHEAALTDALTGLPNRRRLMDDLAESVGSASEDEPLLLALFDLDGFKSYNDNFGHPAGDALLVRLGAALGAAIDGRGRAYRMGGDEFCVLAAFGPGGPGPILDQAQDALTAQGEGFTVTASFGAIVLPTETADAEEALRAADQRMYTQKSSGRVSAGRQTTDALVRVMAERHPDLSEHLDGVTRLCGLVADELGIAEGERGPLLQAASLHDIGKAAIPDAILDKPGPLDDEEWVFIRQHTVIGERILAAAPALSAASALVRSSHERIDAAGYPDGLSGDAIPLGARIIAVCDAYDAMLSSRAYRLTPISPEDALAELRRCAGTQFDARVVEAFARVTQSRDLAAAISSSTEGRSAGEELA